MPDGPGRVGVAERPERGRGRVDGADRRGDAVAGADARAPGDPWDEAVLLDLAVVVVAVAAMIGRDDEEGVLVETGGGRRVEQGAEAEVGVANRLQLRVRHPTIRMTEIVGIGEMNELDLGAVLDQVVG